MDKAIRGLEILLGALFLFSAATKALDMQAFQVQITLYRVLSNPGLIEASAYFAVLLEIVLGAMLVAGLRVKGGTYLVSIGMTVVYSGLIAYAWRYHGLEDCGCFGKVITMGPAASLAKNGIIIALLAVGLAGTRKLDAAPMTDGLRIWRGSAAAASAAVLVIMIYTVSGPPVTEEDSTGSAAQNAGTAFAKYNFETNGEYLDFSAGEWLIVLLSSTCEHCKASVAGLNAIASTDGLPRMAALMIGSEAEKQAFYEETAPVFPGRLIDDIDFALMLNSAPPMLLHVVDGERQPAEWEWADDPPSPETVAAGISGS